MTPTAKYKVVSTNNSQFTYKHPKDRSESKNIPTPSRPPMMSTRDYKKMFTKRYKKTNIAYPKKGS